MMHKIQWTTVRSIDTPTTINFSNMGAIGDGWLVQLFRPETHLIGGGTTFVEVSSGWRPLNKFTVVQSSSDEKNYLSCGQLITANSHYECC